MREADAESREQATRDSPANAIDDASPSEARPTTRFSSAGPLPPVQEKHEAPRPAAPSASDLAFGDGAPLPAPVRAKMEASFGQDFSGVRVHDGGQADAVGSEALTRGENIHFAKNRYQPESERGQELIGHELAHVVQQRAGNVSSTKDVGVPLNDDAGLEAEADRHGAAAARGQVVATEGPRSAQPAARGAAQAKTEGGGGAGGGGGGPDLAGAHEAAKQGIAAMSGAPGVVVSEPPGDMLGDEPAQAAGGASGLAVRPEAGVVGSLQLEYDLCTGHLALIGWIWAGCGAIVQTPIGRQWWGAFTFLEGKIFKQALDFMPKLPSGPRPPAQAGKEQHDGVHTGWGIAGFPIAITPGKMGRFKQAGLEVGVLVMPDASGDGANVELIALLDVLNYLGPLAVGAKRVVEAANQLASKFGTTVEASAGIDASAVVHGYRGPNGLVVDSARLAGGGFVAMGVGLPHSKAELPSGGGKAIM